MQRETDAVVMIAFRETNVNCGRTEINNFIVCFQLFDVPLYLFHFHERRKVSQM
jgi:hypothetical protein